MQARSHGEMAAEPTQIFLCPSYCVVPGNICFKHILKTKIIPPKNVFFPTKNLATGFMRLSYKDRNVL